MLTCSAQDKVIAHFIFCGGVWGRRSLPNWKADHCRAKSCVMQQCLFSAWNRLRKPGQNSGHIHNRRPTMARAIRDPDQDLYMVNQRLSGVPISAMYTDRSRLLGRKIGPFEPPSSDQNQPAIAMP